MNDGKKTYAVISGIVALLLVLALAFTVLMGTNKAVTPKTTLKQTPVRQNTVKRNTGTDKVQAVVRTPDINEVKQSVTVKR